MNNLFHLSNIVMIMIRCLIMFRFQVMLQTILVRWVRSLWEFCRQNRYPSTYAFSVWNYKVWKGSSKAQKVDWRNLKFVLFYREWVMSMLTSLLVIIKWKIILHALTSSYICIGLCCIAVYFEFDILHESQSCINLLQGHCAYMHIDCLQGHFANSKIISFITDINGKIWKVTI